MRPIRATTKIPAPVVRFLKMRSPGRTLAPGFGPGFDAGAPGNGVIGPSGGTDGELPGRSPAFPGRDERPPGPPVGVRVEDDSLIDFVCPACRCQVEAR